MPNYINQCLVENRYEPWADYCMKACDIALRKASCFLARGHLTSCYGGCIPSFLIKKVMWLNVIVIALDNG